MSIDALPQRESGAIALGEKIFGLLDQGRFTATYKYAVLLGLIDLCLEKTTTQGFALETVMTRELAEKVLQLYWSQALPYGRGREAAILLQNTGNRQAEIVASIARFRSSFPTDPLLPIERARLRDPKGYGRLLDHVEWKLIEMPLPRLQLVGKQQRTFLYEIHWDQSVTAARVRAYQEGHPAQFDNRILLKPGVGEQLVQLNGLLRPLLYREWAEQVAQMNRLEAYRLEEFLFGSLRVSTEPVRGPLLELQEKRCFYCGRRIDRNAAVDHFIPWSRYPDNNLANLVAAHAACNGKKRDFLAATEHVERWGRRLMAGSKDVAELEAVAAEAKWPWRRDVSLSVGRGIYFRLPPDAALWRSGETFEEPEFDRLRRALGAA
jgi:5-methylcytosine-specific restriction endonuclease McrA